MKDLTTEILNIIEKEVAPDSQDYIAKQLNELFNEFASLNPERVREILNKYCHAIIMDSGQKLVIYSEDFESVISDLCSGSQEKDELKCNTCKFLDNKDYPCTKCGDNSMWQPVSQEKGTTFDETWIL